jgi:hypothetical protein
MACSAGGYSGVGPGVNKRCFLMCMSVDSPIEYQTLLCRLQTVDSARRARRKWTPGRSACEMARVRARGCTRPAAPLYYYLSLLAPRRSYVLLPAKSFARRDGFMWGRLAACGRLRVPSGRGPASGARLRARRSGPRQPGISRAVGLRLCCSAGQVVNQRPSPWGTPESASRERLPMSSQAGCRGTLLGSAAGCQPAPHRAGESTFVPRTASPLSGRFCGIVSGSAMEHSI